MRFRIFISFLIVSMNILAQRNEFSLNYLHGFPIGGEKAENSSIEYISKNDKLFSLSDNLIQLDYNRKFSQRWNLWFNVTGAYGIRKDQFYIFAPDRILDLQVTNVSRTELGIGFQKRFDLWNSKIQLGLGANFVYRHQNFDIIESSSNYYTTSEDSLFMKYEYSFLSRTDTFPTSLYVPRVLNPRFSIEAKYKLCQNLNLNIGLSYSFNNTVYYRYQTKIYDAKTNYAYPSQIFQQRASRQNYLYVSCGLTYLFEWRKPKKDQKLE